MIESRDPRIHEITLRLGFDRPVSAWMATMLAQRNLPKEITLIPQKEGDPTSVKVLAARQPARRA